MTRKASKGYTELNLYCPHFDGYPEMEDCLKCSLPFVCIYDTKKVKEIKQKEEEKTVLQIAEYLRDGMTYAEASLEANKCRTYADTMKRKNQKYRILLTDSRAVGREKNEERHSKNSVTG